MNIHTKVEPQRDIAARYVELLTGSPDAPREWRFLPDDPAEKKRIFDHEKAERIRTGNRQFCLRRNYTGTLTEVWSDLLACQKNKWGVFCVVNKGGRNANSITEVAANFVDADGIPLPESFEWHVQPNFIVKRDGAHWHAYWTVNDCSLEQFEQAQLRLANFYKTDPEVHDLPRVMRVPGTLHQKHKDGEPSKLVMLEEFQMEVRTFAEIMKGLPELPSQPKRNELEVDGTIITRHQLGFWLARLDSGAMRYSEWRDIIAGIHATPLANDNDASVRREFAHRWSEGLLDWKGRYENAPPGNYDSADSVDATFDSMKPKQGGITYKTIRKMVRDTVGVVNETFGDILDDIGGRVQQDQTSDTKPGAYAKSEDEPKPEDLGYNFRCPVEFKNIPTPRCIIENVVQEKATHILFGKSETGKTFIGVDVAGSVITGLPLFGKFKVLLPGDVVFCCDEAPADLMTVRWPAWCKAHDIDPFSDPLISTNSARPIENPGKLFVVDRCPTLANEQDVRNLATRIHRLKCRPRLIQIDTLAAAMYGLDENSSQDFGRASWAASFLRREFDCAVWYVHHPQKSDATVMRGTSAQMNNVDVVWLSEGDWRAVKITNKKWKSGGANPKPFYLKGDLVPVDRKDDEGRMLSAPVLRFNANPKSDETNGKEHAYKKKVLVALRLAAKNDLLPIPANLLAQFINGQEPKDARAYDAWLANVKATEQRLRRGVFGGRSGKKATGRPGYLADLVQRDSEGEPFDPLRFLLPDHYRTEPGLGEMPTDHDDLGD